MAAAAADNKAACGCRAAAHASTVAAHVCTRQRCLILILILILILPEYMHTAALKLRRT
jgi:hypothetical protein